MTKKEKLNKIFKDNPDFIFYDCENECVGKDLLDLILTLLKAQKKESYIKGYDAGAKNKCGRELEIQKKEIYQALKEEVEGLKNDKWLIVGKKANVNYILSEVIKLIEKKLK